FAPDNSTVQIRAYNSVTNAVATINLKTGSGGTPATTNEITWKSTAGLPDRDNDGLVDEAELAVGTSLVLPDTDGDGINDFAEVQQGLNPLDNRDFPSGIVASLPLQGQAKEVVVVGSTLAPQGQTAYVATGSYGLAIVNAPQFQKPVVLGQIDLPGDA